MESIIRENQLNFNKHFIPLLEILEKNNVPHSVRVCLDGMAIQFEDGSDIALNSVTYGSNEGLLEGYKGAFEEFADGDEVIGFLTAERAWEIIFLSWAFRCE